jgi:hypothetical protein
MNNDYERYDFWFRETATVKNETKEEVIESGKWVRPLLGAQLRA